MNRNFLIKTRTMYDAIVFDNGARLAYIGGSTRVVNLLDDADTIILSKVKYPSNITISEDEKIIAVKTTQKKIEVYSLEDNSLIGKYKSKDNDGSNIFITPDNDYILDGTWDGQICLINIESRYNKTIYAIENTMIQSIDYNSENKIYKFLIKYKVSNRQEILEWKYPFSEAPKINGISLIREANNVKKTKMEYGRLQKLIYNERKCTYLGYSNGGLYIGKSINTLNRIALDCETFRSVCWTSSGDYIFVADTENLRVFEFPSFNEAKCIPLKYSCFVKTFYNDKYICIGSWNNGYVYETEVFLT